MQNQSHTVENSIPLIVLVGPTGIGKSDLSLKLSNYLNIELINVDSRQVYKGMEIGTASPTSDDKKKVPHHGYQILEPDQTYNLSDFLKTTKTYIYEIIDRKNIPLLVGGTGQYIWALLDGWIVPNIPPDIIFREKSEALVNREGPLKLLSDLDKIDPITASTIDRNNIRRVIRALEIYHSTGIPMSELKKREPTPYEPTIIGITSDDRESLYSTIDNRVGKMIDNGWLSETNDLIDKGYKFNLPSFSSMGYKELHGVLNNEIELTDAILKIQKLHHKLARRQYTWFKVSDSRISWINKSNNELNKALDIIKTM